MAEPNPRALVRLRGSLSGYSEGQHWIVDELSGCWNWSARRDDNGYGYCTHGRAHRVVYVQFGHELPDDHHLHHKCENKGCVNPAHLEPLLPVDHKTRHAQDDSTLTWQDVRAIRARAHQGENVYALADAYGLSVGTIHPLIAGRTWKDPEYTRPTWERECPECGVSFSTHRPDKRFCCSEHRSVFGNRERFGFNKRGSVIPPFGRKAA